MSAKTRIRITGTRIPIALYTSGLLEALQTKQQIIENKIAMMMIRVPAPIFPTLPVY
jgi:hypothetical protein